MKTGKIKIVYIAFLFLAVLLFASCKQDVTGVRDDIKNVNISNLTLKIIIDKKNAKSISRSLESLTSEKDSFSLQSGVNVDRYEYTAVCIDNPGAKGTQQEWTQIEISEDNKMILKVEPGVWEIHARGFNKRNILVCEGLTTTNIAQANQEIEVVLNLKDNGNQAMVFFDIAAPYIDGDSMKENYRIGIMYRRASSQVTQRIDDIGFFSVVENEDENYQAKDGGFHFFNKFDEPSNKLFLDEGVYFFTIEYFYKNELVKSYTLQNEGRAYENQSIFISGHFGFDNESEDNMQEEESETDADLIITTGDTQLYPIISGSVGSDIFYCSITNNGVGNLTYSWFADGIELESRSSMLSYIPDVTGFHVIVCAVSGTKGGDRIVGSASIELDYTSADINALRGI